MFKIIFSPGNASIFQKVYLEFKMSRKGSEAEKLKRGVWFMPDLIMRALKERKIFIGYFMLCRYLNGKGYIRYGCNAGYNKPYTNGRERINPCPVLCPGPKIYRSKVYYWCKKLEREGKLLLETTLFYDSKNPNSKTEPHKLDTFVIIALNKEIFDNFVNKYTLDAFFE